MSRFDMARFREAYVANAIADAESSFRHYLSFARCESPMEDLFLAAGLVRGWGRSTQDQHSETWQRMRALGWRHDRVPLILSHVDSGNALVPQVTLVLEGRTVRVDFLVRLVSCARWIAIEIDGHDYHDRTKEQAARDKSRDRALQIAGLATVRFTGSEVYRDAGACWDDVDALADRFLQEAVA